MRSAKETCVSIILCTDKMVKNTRIINTTGHNIRIFSDEKHLYTIPYINEDTISLASLNVNGYEKDDVRGRIIMDKMGEVYTCQMEHDNDKEENAILKMVELTDKTYFIPIVEMNDPPHIRIDVAQALKRKINNVYERHNNGALIPLLYVIIVSNSIAYHVNNFWHDLIEPILVYPDLRAHSIMINKSTHKIMGVKQFVKVRKPILS